MDMGPSTGVEMEEAETTRSWLKSMTCVRKTDERIEERIAGKIDEKTGEKIGGWIDRRIVGTIRDRTPGASFMDWIGPTM